MYLVTFLAQPSINSLTSDCYIFPGCRVVLFVTYFSGMAPLDLMTDTLDAQLESITKTQFATKPAAPDYAAGVACLVQLHPAEDTSGCHQLDRSPITVGRDPSNGIEVPDAAVSRHHAVIIHGGTTYTLRDLHSTNGTYVNDARIVEHVLEAGDRIRIGDRVFKFLAAGDLEAQYHEAVYAMMTTDGLTGVFNTRYLQDVLERDLSRSVRFKRPLSLLMFDLDHFKAVNDTYGHLAGNDVLCEFVARINAELRQDEVFARFGGEEFALLLSDTPREQALVAAERMRACIAAEPFISSEMPIEVTVSIGVGNTDGVQLLTPAELISRADENLYSAKHNGRNCVVG